MPLGLFLSRSLVAHAARGTPFGHSNLRTTALAPNVRAEQSYCSARACGSAFTGRLMRDRATVHVDCSTNEVNHRQEVGHNRFIRQRAKRSAVTSTSPHLRNRTASPHIKRPPLTSLEISSTPPVPDISNTTQPSSLSKNHYLLLPTSFELSLYCSQDHVYSYVTPTRSGPRHYEFLQHPHIPTRLCSLS